jgi:hypothetical protein
VCVCVCVCACVRACVRERMCCTHTIKILGKCTEDTVGKKRHFLILHELQ